MDDSLEHCMAIVRTSHGHCLWKGASCARMGLRASLVASILTSQAIFWFIFWPALEFRLQNSTVFPKPCHRNISLKGLNSICIIHGLEYSCVAVPAHSVDTQSVSSPSRLCLNGSESWGRCSGGNFLCQVAFAAVRDRCVILNDRKLHSRFNETDWSLNECHVWAGAFLSPISSARLSLLAEHSKSAQDHESSIENLPPVHIVSVYSEPRDWYTMFWSCASLAARLAHGFVYHEIIVSKFTFSEKPRQLLAYLVVAEASIDPEAIVWFQDAFDVLMVAGHLSANIALRSVGLEDNDILFNGQCNCFPKDPVLCHEQKRSFAHKGPHYYLNSGQFIGKASAVERLLRGVMRMIDEAGGDWPSTDQGAFMQFCFGTVKGRHHASHVGVRCIVDAGAKLMRTMIRCDAKQFWAEVSSPLDMPSDLRDCHVWAQYGNKCLTDPLTKNQALSLHFNGKGPSRELEIQKMKPYFLFALERSSQDQTQVKRCSYVHVDSVFLGCVDYSRRCSQLLSQAFDKQGSHIFKNKPSGTFETVCTRDGTVFSCLENQFPPLHSTVLPSMCSVGRGLQQESKTSTTENATAILEWDCNKDGVQHRCILKEQSAGLDCLQRSVMCQAGGLLCKMCPKFSAYQLTVDQGIRVLGCKKEKYITAAQNLLRSRFDDHRKSSLDSSLLSEYLLASPSRSFLLRISLINQQLFVANLEHVADQPRAKRVIRQILRVVDFVNLPDFDLIFHIGDGVPDCWPLSRRDRNETMYVPVFVQDMWLGAGAILAPPRSISEVDLAELSKLIYKIAWAEKRPKAVWRGSTTGGFYTAQNWRSFPRSKAVLMSRKRNDVLDAGFTNLHAQADDIAASEMQTWNMSAGRLEYEELFKHQLLLSIDGNAVADRLPSLLVGGSAVIKQDSDRIEFWYSDLQPFRHFFPVLHDLSNLEQIIDVALANKTRIRQMAQAARDVVLDRLHPHCIMCYWIQLLHMYSGFMQRPMRPPAGSRALDACILQ